MKLEHVLQEKQEKQITPVNSFAHNWVKPNAFIQANSVTYVLLSWSNNIVSDESTERNTMLQMQTKLTRIFF